MDVDVEFEAIIDHVLSSGRKVAEQEEKVPEPGVETRPSDDWSEEYKAALYQYDARRRVTRYFREANEVITYAMVLRYAIKQSGIHQPVDLLSLLTTAAVMAHPVPSLEESSYDDRELVETIDNGVRTLTAAISTIQG